MNYNYRILSITAFLTLVSLGIPSISNAQEGQNLINLSSMLAGMFNDGALLLLSFALVVYFFSIARILFQRKGGKINGAELRSTILWGIIALFVMVSIWGLVELLQNTFLDNNSSPASNPSNTSESIQFI